MWRAEVAQLFGGATSQIIGAILLCGLVPVGSASAQDAAALAARLHAMATSNSIDGAGMLPWHLKMDVQLFDAKGKPTEQGTIEEWWGGPQLYRVAFTLPSYKGARLQNKDGAFATKGQTFEPAVLDDLLDAVVHPLPHGEDIDAAKPDLRKQKFGNVELECIMLDQPMKGVAYPPLGLFPTYCLDPGNNDLRVTSEAGSMTFLRNRTGTFQGRLFGVDLSGEWDAGIDVVSGHVSMLKSMGLAEADFTPGADMETVSRSPIKLGAGVAGPKALISSAPVYPEGPDGKNIEGTVVMRIVIGFDGHVHSIHIVSAPDPRLATAAIAAVRRWVFAPYIVDGTPTEVDSTAIIDFAFPG